jgi:hypothetical protein
MASTRTTTHDWAYLIDAIEAERESPPPPRAFPGWRRRGEGPTSVPTPLLTPQENRTKCRKRGQQRWSALVSARTSRISRSMRAHLGERRWRAFVAYADAHYKKQFVNALEPTSGVICCAGPIEGGLCPGAFQVRLDDPRALELLQSMHLEHAHDLDNVCAVWRNSTPSNARKWCDGVDPDRLCRMLFCVTAAKPCLHFRCGWSRSGRIVSRFCHSPRAHYAQVISHLR